jgi:2-polyprenylphenol 6-hydroxylase
MFDVAIVGGGPVGACAAALLARAGASGRSVVLIEPHVPEPLSADAPLESRVVALSRASERILRRAGAWPALDGPRLCAYERMRVWHESVASGSDAVLMFDAADAGEPNLGYIAENRLLQSALLQAFVAGGGVLERTQFRGLRIGESEVRLTSDGGELAARLVIGADGASSAVREAAGLTAHLGDYQQRAIVATVATERPHESSAWQRFMREGTLAFLPLRDGRSSIVWSADEALAARLAGLDDAGFARELDRASDLALGATRLSGPRSAFPLRRLSAPRYVAQRVALIGDAAHVVHPLAGQGVNLGLLDAAALAQLVTDAVRAREDPGALRVLRDYERWRKSEVALMAAAIEAFDRYLAHGAGPVAGLAQRALSWVNGSQELRRVFIRRALGMSGELPRAAQ